MAMMRARHKVYGVKDVPDTKFYRDNGWEPVDPSTPTDLQRRRAEEAAAYHAATSYDPAEHTADEVVEHLADAPAEEASRVVAAEKSGKARKTVLDAAPDEG